MGNGSKIESPASIVGGGNERRLMGSLRDALAAAGAPSRPPSPSVPALIPAPDNSAPAQKVEPLPPPALPSTEAARPVVSRADSHIEVEAPQTKVVRGLNARLPNKEATAARTQLIRGKSAVKRVEFHQDPVVGWLVVVGGQGLGAFRPIFEGNNTVGRGKSQRIPIDFGDETISNEEQAYLRYDSVDRKFLLVPNLAKTNIVAVNDKKPTGAVELAPMDLITMGRTQLVFVPFCGHEFDWAELTEMK